MCLLNVILYDFLMFPYVISYMFLKYFLKYFPDMPWYFPI